MAYPNQKALDLCNFLQEEMNIRLGSAGANITGGVGQVQFDTDGYPWFQIGTAGSTNKGGVIKVQQYSWPNAKDILGNTANQYGPLVIQFCEETHTSDAAGSYNDAPTLAAILFPAVLKGARFEWYRTAFATVPAVSGGINGTLKASFESLYYPLVSGQ